MALKPGETFLGPFRDRQSVQFCSACEVALVKPCQSYAFLSHVVGMEGNIKNSHVEFIQKNGFISGMGHKPEAHIHCSFLVDIDEQHLAIHPIEFCTVWCISTHVAYDQVHTRSR